MLLLDPAAREQLQHQVLSNCNDKHAAVTAAFRVAAQAVAAAASSIAPGSHPSARAAAAAAVEVFGGSASSSGNLSTLADAAGKVDAGMFAATAADPAPEAVAEALQQLRSSYHQELVAATSALFAICRGFGQSTTVAAAALQPIKNALAAAQQQHVRVEQLWQDVLVVAAGNRE
jgi:HAMP domain-containing protein